MDHIAVLLEHVDLLDCLDGLHVHLLQRGLQFLVVGAGALVHFFRLAARSAFASVYTCSLVGVVSQLQVVEVCWVLARVK